MATATTVLIESIVLGILGVAVAYVAAIQYRLSWYSLVGVLALMNIVNGAILRYSGVTPVSTGKTAEITGMPIAEGMSALIVAIIAAVATLVILKTRFGWLTAIALSALTGFVSSLTNSALKAL